MEDKNLERIPMSTDSFFRIDPSYAPKPYDTSGKILPLSQPLEIPMFSRARNKAESESTGNKEQNATGDISAYPCDICKRNFTTKAGRSNHKKKCKEQNIVPDTPLITSKEVIALPEKISGSESPQPTLNTVALHHGGPVIWGTHCVEDIEFVFTTIYDEIVYWRRNLFLLPSGKAGKQFIVEMTRLLDIWNEQVDPLKDVALKAVMIMPSLLLQKPSYKSTAKQHGECLIRRLGQWKEGDFDSLVREARTIQSKLPKHNNHQNTPENLSRKFAKLMLQGKIHASLRLLEKETSGGILNLSPEIITELRNKHPDASPADESMLIEGNIPFVDPAMFANIDETTISKAAMRTKGASGPSGLDADGWRRILVSRNFGKHGKELRESIAKLARKLCANEITDEIGFKSIEAYTACRLIPLDKNPGVRPIGVGEVLRRIVGKAIISIIKPEILDSAGSLQLCAGAPAGCEAAAHSMRDIFEEEGTDALLLVDATNAFNVINRKVLLHNIQYICPAISTYIRNCYGSPSRLFVLGGKEIASSEGTTQGDPFAMPTYAIGIVPLLPLLKSGQKDDGEKLSSFVKHAAYADDLAGAGKLQKLKIWWERVERYGPLLGYHPKASKSWLVVKENKLKEAEKVFKNTEINVTTSGQKYLGTYIGTGHSTESYANGLVNKWMHQMRLLSQIALTEPQAAYAAFISGFKHKLNYHIRTIPHMKPLLAPLDDVIDNVFIPAITEGHRCNEDERRLLSLPVKLGGLGIPILGEMCDIEFKNSRRMTENAAKKIKNQVTTFEFDAAHKTIASEIVKERISRNTNTLNRLRERMTSEEKRANDLTQMKGASSWLSTLPLERENFVLNKREFHDAIRMRYRWSLKYLPTLCACGKKFSVDHAISCIKGGYVHHRHDEIRDVLKNMSEEISNDVEKEPHLQPLTGETLTRSANVADEARLDFSVRGFWQKGQRAFFDVRVFNPFAPTYRNQKLPNIFSANEREKKRAYGQRVIEIEHGSFTPLVFTPYGGCSKETDRFLSVLASRISDKRDIAESVVMNWIRSVLSFALLRSAILCVRGSRNRKKKIDLDMGDIEIVQNSQIS